MICLCKSGYVLFFSLILAFVEGQPPVTHSTTLTVYTDPRTWNEAVTVCESSGGRLLDITYFSLYNVLLQKSQESPWKDIPLGNGPPIWLGLHRQQNLLGEKYYSSTCEALNDFRIIYWNSADPYSVPAGPETGLCVLDQVTETQFPNGVSSSHQYYRANCAERHRFICLYKSHESCTFEVIPGYYGDTGADFSPNGDIVLPFTTTEDCQESCLSESTIFPHPFLKVDEECWGFSTSYELCTLHIVVKPTYFDMEPSSRVFSRKSQLHIKRCFTAAVNTSIVTVPPNESSEPDTACGFLDIGSSKLTFPRVTVFDGLFTWNDAFKLCTNSGQQLLKIQSEDDTEALAQVIEKYRSQLRVRTFWLGLHEPDPIYRPNIRQWTNCEYETYTDWDESPPESDRDDHLCAVVDAALSHEWVSKLCYEQHHVLCIGTSDSVPTYSNEERGVIGSGLFLGPIPGSSRGTCEHLCTNSTYMNEECWAYAYLDSPAGACYLFFSEDQTHYLSHVTAANTSFVFYRKMIWTGSIEKTSLEIADTSLFPYSCCDSLSDPMNCSENNTNGNTYGHDVSVNSSCGSYQSVAYPYSRDENRCQTVSSTLTTFTLLPSTTIASQASSSALQSTSSSYLFSSSAKYSSSFQEAGASSQSIRPSRSDTSTAATTINEIYSSIDLVWSSYTSQESIQVFATEVLTSSITTIQSSLDFHWSSSSEDYSSVEATPTSIGSVPYTSSNTVILSPSTAITTSGLSSSLTTPVGREPFTPKAIYLAPCFCRSASATKLSLQELERLLRDEHTIHAKNTSRYRRAVTSARDNRTSSVSIGTTAILLLASIGLFLIIVDVPIVAKTIKHIHGHTCTRRRVKDKNKI